MPDYNQGQLYMLECDDLIYVGSTAVTLEERYSKHKNNWNRYNSGKSTKYCSSYKLLEKNKPINIILLLEYPCNSKRELEELEQHYINEIDCVNDKRAFRSLDEYRKQVNDYKKSAKGRETYILYKQSEKYKEKYEKNREAHKEYMKKYHRLKAKVK